MTTSLKKLLLISITLLLGVMSGGVAQSQTATLIDASSGNSYSVSRVADYLAPNQPTVPNPLLLTTPWWGSATLAQSLSIASHSTALSSSYFVYEVYPSDSYFYDAYLDGASTVHVRYSQYGFAVSSSGAPEIDGSLAPKVGFLLGCLFLMFGRKKQNSGPTLA